MLTNSWQIAKLPSNKARNLVYILVCEESTQFRDGRERRDECYLETNNLCFQLCGLDLSTISLLYESLPATALCAERCNLQHVDEREKISGREYA